jgi:hypothetical protein
MGVDDMLRQTRTFNRKLTGTGAALSAVLPPTSRARPWHVAVTSFGVALSNYLLGELFVTPRYGRRAGIVTEGVNAGITTMLTSRVLPGMEVGPLGVVAAAGAVGVTEWFGHSSREQRKADVHADLLKGARELVTRSSSDNGSTGDARPRRAIAIKRRPEDRGNGKREQ